MKQENQKPQQIKGVGEPALPVWDRLGEIGSGTNSKSDAPLTQPGSLDVHAIPETIGALTAMRTRHGADSAIGHHCTTIMEQLAELENHVRAAWQKDERQTLQMEDQATDRGLGRIDSRIVLSWK